jgi:hypothetical protein
MSNQFFPATKTPIVKTTYGISLCESGDVVLFNPPSQALRINPLAVILDIETVNGTPATAPQVTIDNGTDGSNISGTITLTSAAENRSFLIQPVLGGSGMSRVVTAGATIRLKKSVLGVGQATTLRKRENNIATITTAAAHGLAVGDKVVVGSLGGTGYNGTVTVSSVPSTTVFTYTSVGTDEAEPADTDGRVGNIIVNATVIAAG